MPKVKTCYFRHNRRTEKKLFTLYTVNFPKNKSPLHEREPPHFMYRCIYNNNTRTRERERVNNAYRTAVKIIQHSERARYNMYYNEYKIEWVHISHFTHTCIIHSGAFHR